MTTIPHPSFLEKMQRFYGQMEQALYSAECTCHNDGEKCIGDECPFSATPDHPFPPCSLSMMRYAIGNHPAHFCQPCEPTQPECGPCKGPGAEQSDVERFNKSMHSEQTGNPDPKCPKCGGATFRANIDDLDMILCYNDACKWKGPAEIGQCPEGELLKDGKIACTKGCYCDFRRENYDQRFGIGMWYECAREDAALVAAEEYQREIKEQDGGA